MKYLSKYRLIFIFSILGLFSFTNGNRLFHDFHTSLSEIRYNKDNDSYEVTIRVFTDDLLLALESVEKGVSIDLENEASNQKISLYLKRHFAFVKDKKVEFGKYLGKEVEADATWLYVEFMEVKKIENYNLLNTIFLSQFEDQNNLVNYIYPDKRHTLLFNQNDRLKPIPH